MSMAQVEYEVGTVSVEMPYDKELIAELKGVIPVTGRKWNSSRRVWVFTDDWWDEAQRIIGQYFEIED